MAKSIKDNPKKTRGRPATGKDPMVGVRMSEELQKTIRVWAARQDDKPSLATSIRRLVERGLAGEPPGRVKRSASSPKPSELANTAIDHLADKSAPADEQASRKRRLLKGPEEFRETRIDKPKAKK